MKAHPRSLVFLLSSLGLIVFPHVNHIPVSIFAYFYLLLGWRWFGLWQPAYLPNKSLLLILTLIGMALLYREHQGLFGRDAGTRLFVLALGLKLMEINRERDLYLISFLTFIVAASQFLYEQNLLMGGYILLVCGLLLATLIGLNSQNPKAITALKTASLLLAQALPIAIVLFVLFPRLEAPHWMLLQDKQQTKTGLSEQMEPGSITDLGQSDELVFRVNFAGAMPPPSQRYWRGPVLSQTDGKRWTQAKNKDFGQFMAQPEFKGQRYQYTLLMEPRAKNWVFALDLPAEFSGTLRRNSHYQLISSDNLDKRTEYQISSYPAYNTGFITRTEYDNATQLPGEPSAKIKQLVTQLQGVNNPPELVIEHLLGYFRTEDFHYTLTPPLMEDKPIETFLFVTRYGFCSHYAAAFVYLMRVAHIPARVVTGYQGGEVNPVGNFLEVRQADAHAWAEVWLTNKGWVRVDPTAAIAPERIEKNVNLDALEMGREIRFSALTEQDSAVYHWLKQANQLWHLVDYQWQRWVINYNTVNQLKFLSSLGIANLQAMLSWLVSIVGVITAILAGLLLHQKTRAIDQSLRSYQQFCQKLAKQGVVRADHEGAKDFAERAITQLPEHATAIMQITERFIALRYGRQGLIREDLQQLQHWVRELKL